MKEITVTGGKPLFGRIEPSGSKNAALPIIFASLITRGVSVIENAPDIGDVRVAIKMIEELGAKVHRNGNSLTIDTTSLEYARPRVELTSKIRASSYLIGACLGRFGVFHLSDFGGCNFCNRPIDMHLYAAEKLGARIEDRVIKAEALGGNLIKFDKISVGATINAIIMAASAKGETLIMGASNEPHVRALIDYLSSAGAKIEICGDRIRIEPTPLGGGRIKVISDMIEAGTFLLLGPLTGGSIEVVGAADLELDVFFDAFYKSGIDISYTSNSVSFIGEAKRRIEISTAPHPGYPTDLQPQVVPLMAAFCGGSIEENVWQNRFSYLDELRHFGICYSEMAENKVSISSGKINHATASAPDLRGGAAAVMCALAAAGESKIKNADLIERGYSDFIGKLSSIGAEIYKDN